MIVGVPKEIKNHEYRVGLSPASVAELVGHGHKVMVETEAGTKIGFTDNEYRQVGANIVSSQDEIFKKAEMIVKVKEPQPDECEKLREGQILFTYLHLAPDPVQTELLVKSGASCIAYETVTDIKGGLPLLTPMSEVAGRLSILEGTHHMMVPSGGQGMLISGVPGTEPAKVVIIGGGVVGYNAAIMAVGLKADVTILDVNIERLRELHTLFNGKVRCIYSNAEIIEKYCTEADLIVGAVLVPGASAPKVVSAELVSKMRQGTVLVDVAIDQGGCFETSKATTHEQPTYIIDGVVHYCVANMPGAVARTSTVALNNVTLPFAISIANKGLYQALLEDKHLLAGLNVHEGQITCHGVADALAYDYVDPSTALHQTKVKPIYNENALTV
jgi:alanine dehydrogenase